MRNKRDLAAEASACRALLVLACALAMAGCRQTVDAFPAAATTITCIENGTVVSGYDLDGDGAVDFESHARAGAVVAWAFDTDADGVIETTVPRGANRRHVVVVVDSIPIAMVEAAYRHGRFRYAHPPRATISPFPVMTDLSLNDLWATGPAPAVETDYYDGRRMVDGWGPYRRAENSAWLASVDWFVPYGRHGGIYLDAAKGFRRETEALCRSLAREEAGVAYVVSTSALGITEGRDGHAMALTRLDRFCLALIHHFRGKVDITLLSDHGMDYGACRRIPLRRMLKEMGYRVADTLAGVNDVVVPAFGLVSCAAIYTQSAERVARDLVLSEGVALAAHREDGDAVLVHDRSGTARVEWRGDRYRYTALAGDPLRWEPVIAMMRERDALDADAFGADTEWRQASEGHEYPDALHRLRRAFTGQVVHVPDVMLSLAPGFFFGSPFMSHWVKVGGCHGSLRRESSLGFVLTTRGPLPNYLRMDELWTALHATAAEGSDARADAP